MVKGKSLYIETIKAYAIIFVVFVHISGMIEYATSLGCYKSAYLLGFFGVISRCGVPLFFAISGYLLFKKEFDVRENVRKKVRTLVVPYFIWTMIWLVFFQVGWCVVGSEFENVLAWDAGEWFKGIFGIPFLETPFYPALWYVRDLFLLNLIAPVFAFVVKKLGGHTLWIALLIWIAPGPFYLCEAVSFFLFGCIAAYCPQLRERILVIRSRGIILVLAVSALVLNGLFRGDDPVSTVLDRTAVVLFCVFLLNLFHNRAAQENFVVKWVAPNVFIILVTHHKLIAMLSIIGKKALPGNSITITLLYFVLPCITIFLCVIFSESLKRVNMRLYTMLTGGR